MSSDSHAHPVEERSPQIGAMLRVVWQWVRAELYSGVVEAGYDDLSEAHVGLWRYPGLDGLRPSQLADRVGITKQSVNDLLGQLEQRGYLLRAPDPTDGRARVIRLTSKGRRLEQQVYDEAGAVQQRVEAVLGRQRSAQLHSSLALLAERLT